MKEISIDNIVKNYTEQGFVTISQCFAKEELLEIVGEVHKIARGEYPCPTLQSCFPEHSSAEQISQQLISVHEPHMLSSLMEGYLKHETVSLVLSNIAGAHLKHWDGRTKLIHSMAYMKPSMMGGHPWHQDEAFFPTRDRSLTAVYVALDSINEENGCLWFIPGSHKYGYMYPSGDHNNSEYLFSVGSKGFDESEAVPVIMEPGDITFFNGYLLHKSTKNKSMNTRAALVGHYCNSWSLLPVSIPDQVPKEEVATAIAASDNRKVFSVSGDDPYEWKGYDRSTSECMLRRF